MHWPTAYLLSIVITLICLGGVMAYAWRFRYARGAGYFLTFGAGAFLWTLLVGVMAISPPEASTFWLKLKYLVIAFEPVPVLLFVLAYTGRERWLKRSFIASLCVIPAITQVVVWTNGAHQLMLRSLEMVSEGGLTYITEISYGPWYWVHALYGYLLTMGSAGIVALAMVRGGSLVRRQGLPIMIGVLAPLAANVVLLTKVAPPEMDPMPFGLAATAVLLGWGGFRHQLLNLVPVARSRLVESVREGMLVLDDEGRIVDLNPAMRQFLGVEEKRVVGKRVREALRDPSDLRELFEGELTDRAMETGTEIRIGEREFEARIVALGRGPENQGRLIVLNEQTQRKRMEREREKLITELQDALGQVKTLRGMLPVCANCKKVRDDEGYWHQVDVYIRKHSEAEITHGICPECEHELYPEYATPKEG